MAAPSTLYRFRIDLSDVDRGVYENLDFRVAMHPSETPVFLVTRVLAFLLNCGEGLEFAPGGLSDTDAPALLARDTNGGFAQWIEIGNPSVRKMHKATKACKRVKVYTYKDPELLLKEMRAGEIYQVERVEVYSFSPGLLDRLAESLERSVEWSVMHNEGSLVVGDEQGELLKHPV